MNEYANCFPENSENPLVTVSFNILADKWSAVVAVSMSDSIRLSFFNENNVFASEKMKLTEKKMKEKRIANQ